MGEAEGHIRLAFNIPKELRYKLQDAAFILKVTETQLASEAIEAYLRAVEAKKGEKFTQALAIVREAREGD
jgi:hypothetical protein